MNVADRVTLKQMYLQDTGQHKPEIDEIEWYLQDVIEFIGLEKYQKAKEETFFFDEPDCKSINHYIEWLEEKILEK